MSLPSTPLNPSPRLPRNFAQQLTPTGQMLLQMLRSGNPKGLRALLLQSGTEGLRLRLEQEAETYDLELARNLQAGLNPGQAAELAREAVVPQLLVEATPDPEGNEPAPLGPAAVEPGEAWKIGNLVNQ